MERRPKVYLAGPEVFLPDAIAMGERKKALAARYGFEGLFPLDNAINTLAPGDRLDQAIYRANVALIRAADLGICNLTPFRGPSADVGTVFELGMLVGLGKPAFGYSNVACDLLERVRLLGAVTFDAARGQWCDGAGHAVEDFGNADNLMIDGALKEQGHPPIRHETALADQFADLSAFEECLRQAADAMASQPRPLRVRRPALAG